MKTRKKVDLSGGREERENVRNFILRCLPVGVAVKKKLKGGGFTTFYTNREFSKISGIFSRVHERRKNNFMKVLKKVDSLVLKNSECSFHIAFRDKVFLVRAKYNNSNEMILLTVTDVNSFYEKLMRDELTGLLRREKGLEVLRYSLEMLEKTESPFSVLLLDIDNFKPINDTYGHICGDRVLKGIGRVIREVLRKTDTGIRYGGEEILVVLPLTKFHDAVKVAEKLRDRIKSLRFKCLGNRGVTVSVGVFEVDRPMSITQILKEVDKNLYFAKRLGKDRIYPER